MRILVAGATGTLGQALVKALHDHGHQLIAHGRDRQKLRALQPLVKEIRPADVTDPDAMAGICHGVDLVISTVGLVGARALKSRATHEQVDYEGNLNLLREAERAGVRKFVYVSVQHAGEDADVPLLDAKRRVEEALRASSLDWLIVRPTVYFEQIRQGLLDQARRGVAFLVGSGETRAAPLDAADLARFIVQHLDDSRQILTVGGPDALSYNEMARTAFETLGKTPRIVHVPPGVVDAAAAAARPLPMAASGELSYLKYALTHDHVAPPIEGRHLRDDFLEHREA